MAAVVVGGAVVFAGLAGLSLAVLATPTSGFLSAARRRCPGRRRRARLSGAWPPSRDVEASVWEANSSTDGMSDEGAGPPSDNQAVPRTGDPDQERAEKQ